MWITSAGPKNFYKNLESSIIPFFLQGDTFFLGLAWLLAVQFKLLRRRKKQIGKSYILNTMVKAAFQQMPKLFMCGCGR